MILRIAGTLAIGLAATTSLAHQQWLLPNTFMTSGESAWVGGAVSPRIAAVLIMQITSPTN